MGKIYINRILLSFMCVIITGLLLMMASRVLGDKYEEKTCNNQNVGSKSQLNKEIDNGNMEDELTLKLQSSFKDEHILQMSEYPILTPSALKVIYDRNIHIEVKGEDYSIIFKGEDLTDYTRELDTFLEFKKVDKGYKIKRELSKIIPGNMLLKINNKDYKGKYIYIYNSVQDKYMLLSDDGKGIIEIGNNEEYLVLDKQLYELELDYKMFIYVAGGIVILMMIYILIKKRYWFW